MSSKRRIRGSACLGKLRYTSQGDAQAAMKALHHRKGYQGSMTPYRCEVCGGYHFCHPPKAKGRPR